MQSARGWGLAIAQAEGRDRVFQVLEENLGFWAAHHALFDSNSVIIDGAHYRIGDEMSPPRFRGFGGRRFTVKFHDGRVVETCNLWSQGRIEEEFRQLLPDNAVFL